MHCSSCTNVVAALCCVGSDIGGAARSKVVYGVLFSKLVDLLKVVKDLLRPLIVVESLSVRDSYRAFVRVADNVALREQSNALRVSSALTESKADYLSGLIRIGACGRRYGSNSEVLGFDLGSPCCRVGSYSVWSNDIEELSALRFFPVR